MGNTWQFTQINNTNDIKFHSIHFPSEDIGYAVGDGPYETMMKTTDGGDTWNVIPTGISSSLNVVHFDDEMNGLVFGQNGVILKTNSGGVVSISEDQNQTTNNFFSVYPNPFSEAFTVNHQLPAGSQNIKIELFCQAGKLEMECFFSKGQSEVTIPAKHLIPGIYLIRLISENKIIETRKLIKLQ